MKTQRVDFRVSPQLATLAGVAAGLKRMTLSEFVRQAVEDRAHQVMKAAADAVAEEDAE